MRGRVSSGQAGQLPGKQEVDEVSMVHTLVLSPEVQPLDLAHTYPEIKGHFLTDWCLITKLIGG